MAARWNVQTQDDGGWMPKLEKIEGKIKRPAAYTRLPVNHGATVDMATMAGQS
jgi:hypothetical protein